MLGGASWQRCRVHFMRHLLATVPHGAREPVAALVRTIFAQPDHRSALAQLQKVADGLRPRFAQATALLAVPRDLWHRQSARRSTALLALLFATGKTDISWAEDPRVAG